MCPVLPAHKKVRKEIGFLMLIRDHLFSLNGIYVEKRRITRLLIESFSIHDFECSRFGGLG